MGREVRMVPSDWQHPMDEHGEYIPLLQEPWEKRAAAWDLGAVKWAEGLREDFVNEGQWVPKKPDEIGCTYEEWAGCRPCKEDYMPTFAPGTATHYMMYETCTEGTPISPAFETPEKLARWLVDNSASALGDQGASYEGWLRVAKGGYAPSMVLDSGGLRSGVEL